MSLAVISNSTSRLCSLALLGATILCAVGCGGPFDSKVSGKVTLDGVTLSTGMVAFVPVSNGPAAFGRIDSSGNYVVETGREVGLPSGEYRVAVGANEEPKATKSADGGPVPTGKALTPVWYARKDTSGLKYTVTKGSNTINLELNSKPPAGWKPPPGRK
ncbi:MAG TPA: hypothetical protein VHU84_01285 [Lacipirellulaceae bacterium]|jgi:hypothetical protein|nr:hypothetical protein [Lacipirellulaceae bacterium]